MKFRPVFSWFCFFIVATTAHTQVAIEYFKFRTITGESYLDVVIDIPGEDCEYLCSDDSSFWQSTTSITVIAESNGQITQFKKTNLLSPEFTDSTEASSTNQVHLERLLLETGRHKLTVEIEAKSRQIFEENIEITISGAPEISSTLLIEAYAPADEGAGSKFYRSGYEMIPFVGSEISTSAEKLRLYTELYNINEVVGEDSLFLLVFGLTDSNGNLDPNHTRYKRINAHQVTPVFETLPISSTTLRGLIVIQAKTRDGHLICESSTPISRWKPQTNISIDNVNFGDKFIDAETLYRHLEDHLPLATPSQQHGIGWSLKHNRDIDILRGFLEYFWISRNPDDPEGAWMEYCGEIAIVDSVFGGCRGGHGADTDMGYVYLKYGKPNTIVKRHHDTDYYPYEIWHYHHTNGFTNKRFLFFAPHVVLECMEILQSDMPGEIKNDDWLQLLKSRENRTQVVDSQLNRLNPRDTYSREEPEDLYFNPR